MGKNFYPLPSNRCRQGLIMHKREVAVGLLLMLAASAQAHTDQMVTGGFVSGYLHPLTGLDHLLAMIAVGIWGRGLASHWSGHYRLLFRC